MKRTLVASALLATLLAGCANMSETQRGTAVGGGVGAVAGAVLGNMAGNSRAGAVLGGAAGALGGYVWSKRMEDQKRAMEQAAQGTGVAVTQTADNQLKLEVPSDVSFDVGQSQVKQNFRPVLEKFALSLRDHPETTLRIIGHTDSTGSDAINNPLSVNRAASTRDYLAAHGVDSRRVAIDGHGSREPVADNTSEAGRARNRRVDILIGEPMPAAQNAPAAPPPSR